MTDQGMIFITGILAGIILWDLRQRRKDTRDMRAHSDEMKRSAVKLNEVHNGLVLEVQRLGDKVSSHEFILKSSRPNPDLPLGGKKFGNP